MLLSLTVWPMPSKSGALAGCYLDGGARTVWTTILVDVQDGLGEYQLLCPRVQEALAHLVADDIIDKTDFDSIANMLIERELTRP